MTDEILLPRWAADIVSSTTFGLEDSLEDIHLLDYLLPGWLNDIPRYVLYMEHQWKSSYH